MEWKANIFLLRFTLDRLKKGHGYTDLDHLEKRCKIRVVGEDLLVRKLNVALGRGDGIGHQDAIAFRGSGYLAEESELLFSEWIDLCV